MPPTEIMWTAGIAAHPFREQVVASAALEYRAISVGMGTVERCAQAGLDTSAMRRFAVSHGVKIELVEPIVTWLPVHPSWPPARFDESSVIRAATQLGASSVCAIAGRGLGLSGNEIAERFAALAGRLAEHGLLTCIEFAPMSGVRDLAAARQLVAAAGPERAGVIFDTWHYFRGGGEVAALAGIPSGLIRYVQVSDALPDSPASLDPASLDKDTYNRELPGNGCFPLAGALAALDAVGALDCAGPEVISPELSALGCAEAARRITDAYRRVRAEAGM